MAGSPKVRATICVLDDGRLGSPPSRPKSTGDGSPGGAKASRATITVLDDRPSSTSSGRKSGRSPSALLDLDKPVRESKKGLIKLHHADSTGRLQKSKSLINLPGERNKFFTMWSPNELAPEVVEACAAAARTQAGRLPKDSSEVRLARLRQPRGALERRLRRGAAVDDVLDDAALRVAEKWIVAIRPVVPEEYWAEAVAHLAHGDLSAKVLPEGPLRDALQRIVPHTRRAAIEGWEFMDSLIEALELEDQMDKKSVINAAGPHPTIRLTRACGSQPKVWREGPVSSGMARFGKQTDGFRATATGFGNVAWVPGPGHYDPASFDLPLAITRPHRGEFPSVGRRRAVCTTMSLYHRIREL